MLLWEVCPVSRVRRRLRGGLKTPRTRGERPSPRRTQSAPTDPYIPWTTQYIAPIQGSAPGREGIHLIVLVCPSIPSDRSARGICRVSWQTGIRRRDPPVPDHVSCRQFYLLRVRLEFTSTFYIVAFGERARGEWRVCVAVSRVIGLMSCRGFTSLTPRSACKC